MSKIGKIMASKAHKAMGKGKGKTTREDEPAKR